MNPITRSEVEKCAVLLDRQIRMALASGLITEEHAREGWQALCTQFRMLDLGQTTLDGVYLVVETMAVELQRAADAVVEYDVRVVEAVKSTNWQPPVFNKYVN